jgi:putative nucleotidyltransferase with HDIG domain
VHLALPDEVARIAARLQQADHAVYLVGGAVRDGLLGREPHDYDLATDATPEQVLPLFPGARADDVAFGRVLVGSVDVLTLRRESQYKDRRRPSVVRFTRSVRADLSRRDFTINAMALDLRPAPGGEAVEDRLIDPFGGARDLELGVLRTVGDPMRRFGEDALRVLRAIRLRAELGFSYERRLAGALREAAAGQLLTALAAERVRDELSRILVSLGCADALRDLVRYGLLRDVLPECLPMVGCAQMNPMHQYDVWEHSVRAVQAIAPTLTLRWAALLHDVAKPACRTFEHLPPERPGTPERVRTHFYGHEVQGAEMARAILRRLRYPDWLVARVSGLVRHHMFSYAPNTRAGSARRLVLALGMGGAFELLEVRHADRQASRWPSGYGRDGERLLAHLRALLQARERFTLRDLAIDGHDVMRSLGLGPGPAVGAVLRTAHQLVLDEKLPNRREELLRWLSDQGLAAAAAPGAGPGDDGAPAGSEAVLAAEPGGTGGG